MGREGLLRTTLHILHNRVIVLYNGTLMDIVRNLYQFYLGLLALSGKNMGNHNATALRSLERSFLII